MLVEDIYTYLTSFGAYSDDGDTFTVRTYMMPPTPNAVIVISEGELSGEDVRAMGASLGSPIREQPMLRIRVRSEKRKFASARTVAETVHQRLQFLNSTLSTRRYFIQGKAPYLLEQDRNDRVTFEMMYVVQKERG